MIGFLDSGASCDTTPKNPNLRPYYALKYCVDICADSANGYNIPQSVIDTAIANIANGDFSDFIVLWSASLNDYPTGSYVYENNNLIHPPTPVISLFDTNYNSSNQVAFFRQDGNDIISSPALLDNFNYCSDVNCALEGFTLVFETPADLQALPVADKTSVDDWNNYFIGAGWDAPNFTSVNVNGNRVSFDGNLNSIISIASLYNGTLIQIINLGLLTNLAYFEMYSEKLTAISFNNTPLTQIHLNDNQLTSLTLSGLVNLTILNVSQNEITTIVGIASCVALTNLDATNNSITGALVLPASLTELLLSQNQITGITNIASLVNLISLVIDNNLFTGALDVSASIALVQFIANDNQLTAFTLVAVASDIEFINVANNNLSGVLDVSAHTRLINLTCNDNAFTEINFAPTADYTLIICRASNNQIASVSDILVHLAAEAPAVPSRQDLDFTNNLLTKTIIGEIFAEQVASGKYYPNNLFNGTGNEAINSVPAIVADYNTLKAIPSNVKANDFDA